MIYLTGDWHYNHTKILKYCNRPFADIEENNITIIKNHSKIIGPDDILIHMGDIALTISQTSLKLLIDRIPAYKKILIRGNHDRFGKKTYLKCGFDAVYKNLYIGNIHFTHRPSKSHKKAWLNIVAHAHDVWKVRENQVNVGVDVWNFKPVALAEVLSFYRNFLKESTK